MKTVRIAFAGFWEEFNKSDNFIVDVLKKKYYVQIIDTEKNPTAKNSVQYLFYSDFSDEYLDYDCIRIFYTGENISPDMNACDYAIGFDHFELGDRYIRYPLYLALYEKDVNAMLSKNIEVNQSLTQRKFCSMVVSHSTFADPARKDFFEKLSEYRQVDSGGRYLNNIGKPEGVTDKLDFQKQYKFSIAFENSSHPGYCTEKLVQGFAAQTIPIYWGDPQVNDYFVAGSFINCHDYKDWDEVVNAVKTIDENNDLYMSMLREPAVDVYKMEEQRKQFCEWLWHIMDQEYPVAFRRNLFGRCILKENELKRKEDAVQEIQRPLLKRIIRRVFYSFLEHNLKKGKVEEGKQTEVEKCFGNKNPDNTFYVIRREGEKLGLMSFFNTHLGHINYAIQKGYIPVIDMQNYKNIYLEESDVGKKNAWEFFFEQPYKKKYSLEEVYQSRHVILCDMSQTLPRPDDNMDFLMNKLAYRYWHEIYCQYCQVNETIEKAVKDYYDREFKPYIKKGGRILGVLLRGTDYYSLRPQGHPIQPDIDVAVAEVEKYMKKWNCTNIYLVTEDEEILRKMTEEFSEKMLRYDSKIYKYSGSGYIGDAEGIQRENDKYERGKEYLCSVLLLTKCNCFIGGRTSGTVAMHVMSEGFEHEHFFDYGRYGIAEY